MIASLTHREPTMNNATADFDFLSELYGTPVQENIGTTLKSAVMSSDSIIAALMVALDDATTRLNIILAKTYKPNPKTVALNGDGPAKRESMSITDINASKKRKQKAATESEIVAIQSVIQLAQADCPKLVAIINTVHDLAQQYVANKTARVATTVGGMFEYLILKELGIQPADGSFTTHPVSKILLTLVAP